MEPTGDTRPSPTQVKRQRQSYSCTECTRRKLRCSKRIPCLACIERGIAHQCRRRSEVGRKETRRSIQSPKSVYAPALQPVASSNTISYPPEPTPRDSTSHGQGTSIVDSVTQDAAIMLEFLALNRRHVLQAAQVDGSQTAETVSNTYEFLFTAAQVRNLMIYHQEWIAWIHNVVHMPTFLEQCEEKLGSGATPIEGGWLSLYYAMLAVTLYHANRSKLEGFEIYSGDELALLCYQKSIDSLNQADFMKNHSLFSVQAICLLIYIGHNIGESDRVSVLLASGSRIAQCLAIHRLGPDRTSSILQCADPILRTRRLIDREISKRVWWFLVRQDWLQIPFNNTYNIHPSQFNTPMPKNCDEAVFEMIIDGDVKQHNQDHYTQGSYTAVLNQMAMIIWEMEDRMCQKRAQEETARIMRDLYSDVLQADRQMKQLIAGTPAFFRSDALASAGAPAHILQQRAILLLSFAHKFYSVHRHFQIPSLQDPWFAYTKISCLPIMRRHLAHFLSLPEDDPSTPIAKNLWTVNTQVLTATVWLLFELIFSKESEPLFDAQEIRTLASRSLKFLQSNQHKSSVAKRGVGLIESLLETDRAMESGMGKQFSLQEIISLVELKDSQMGASSPRETSEIFFAPMLDNFSGNVMQWEDILSAFCEI